MTAVLETRDLVKSFGANRVLKGINLEFRSGEVTALLGANGAGKSTFLGCISGAETPSGGEILIGGEVHTSTSPREAIEAGIGMIYQHFQLIGALTIADNVFLGSEIRTALGTTDRRAQERETMEQLLSLGLRLNPAATVETLSVGQQQIVEIIRSLRKNPRVLILDEPTAALSRSEVEALLELVSSLARERDIAVIYVSHILSEVMQVADRVIVLRDGVVHEDRLRGDFTMADLVEAISPGRASAEARERVHAEDRPIAAKLLGFEGSASGPVTIEIHESEVVGVFGLLGSGRTNLLETLAGIRPRYAGRLELHGKQLNIHNPKQAASQGVVLVPADRKTQALYPDMTAVDNVVLPHMKKLGGFVRSKRAELKAFEAVADALSVHPNNPSLAGSSFSGGNAQKLMIGRWTNPASNAQLLLLDEPTQGVDVGAREDIYAFVRSYVDEPGRCAIFSTSEYEEAVALADRIIVLHDGNVTGIVEPDVTESKLMSLAFGQPEMAA